MKSHAIIVRQVAGLSRLRHPLLARAFAGLSYVSSLMSLSKIAG
jgi:hypothetical protein